MIVFFLRKSRTATFPRFTVVSVPSQRSATVQIVPRTVATLLRPLVRKRPLAFPRSLRTVRLLRRRLEAVARLPRRRTVQRLKLEPLRRSSVRPLCFFLRDWRVWKRPSKKSPV